MSDEAKSPEISTMGDGGMPPSTFCSPMYRAFVAFIALTLVCILVYGFADYRTSYGPTFSGHRIGDLHYVEISLVREDINALACASDKIVDGAYCAYRADGQRRPDADLDERKIIRQYNSVRNEPFMAIGLWDAPVMTARLPDERFSVVCEFIPVGAMKSPKLRWSATGQFIPTGSSLVVGRLATCVIPQ